MKHKNMEATIDNKTMGYFTYERELQIRRRDTIGGAGLYILVY
jgi:hypothetical protein